MSLARSQTPWDTHNGHGARHDSTRADVAAMMKLRESTLSRG